MYLYFLLLYTFNCLILEASILEYVEIKDCHYFLSEIFIIHAYISQITRRNSTDN